MNKSRSDLTPFFAPLPGDFLEARLEMIGRLGPRAGDHASAVASLAAKGRHSPALDVNIVGVGIGEKVTAGARTGSLAVKVLVAKKFPKSRIGRGDLLPRSIGGIPTDIEAVGYARKLVIGNRLRQRPLMAGASISPTLSATRSNALAGTLGMFATEIATKRLHFISNNHVIAYENAVPAGDPMLQPGSLDGGGPRDAIGRVSHIVKLKFGNRRNWMDAAAAAVAEGIDVDRLQSTLGIGAARGSALVKLNSLVRKSGRTTGLTEGVVRTVKLDLFNIEYDGGMVRMDDIFAVEGASGLFSKAGDSGSGVVDHSGAVVGLLFAGSDVQTFVIPIRRILRRLKMRIA